MARKFIPVTLKVNVFILISLTIGIGSVSFMLTRMLSDTIVQTTEDYLQQESSIVYEAIEQLMLPGEAPLVVNYVSGISEISSVYEIGLYRRSGVPAFSDNMTIEAVNDFNENEMFGLRNEPAFPPTMVTNEELFNEALGPPPHNVTLREVEGDRVFVRFYKPLLNLPKCTICHPPNHTVRGVIDLRTDITASIQRQRQAIYVSAGLFLMVVTVTSVVMSIFLKRGFISPLQEIGTTCTAVSEGNFERRSMVSNNDELGRLSDTVNTMVQGLYERYVLTRYVSSSTVRSLGDTTTTRSEELTLLFSDIRGFTSFSERNAPEEVVSTLNEILSMQTEILTESGGDIDKYVGDEIVAVFSGDAGIEQACRAAVEIQHRLREGNSPADLHVGIGINHGSVIVGSVGSDTRADFTVIGDNVNIAARLCSGAGKGEILISDTIVESTRLLWTDSDDAIEGPFRMKAKGKSEALRVFKIHPERIEDARA